MKKEIRISRLVAPIAACLLIANTAVAHESGKSNESYVGDSNGHYITDGSGNCVRTGAFNKEDMTVDCGAAPPMKEVKAPPPPPPPAPPPAMPVYETVTLSAHSLFGFDSDTLSSEGKASLDTLGENIKAKGAKVVDINVVGHTDSTGPAEYNQQLSLRRATSVKDYLVTKGVDASIIDISGMGESNPVADNGTREGRAQNRRVDVSIGVKRQK